MNTGAFGQAGGLFKYIAKNGDAVEVEATGNNELTLKADADGNGNFDFNTETEVIITE